MLSAKMKTYVNLRQRFDACEVCGLKGTWDYSAFLEVHHIDRDPENSHPSNLQVLCHNCHGTIHRKRYKRERNNALIKTDEQLRAENELYDYIRETQDSCAICGRSGTWSKFTKTKLIFHHVNGDRGDNSPDNLMVVHATACHKQAHLICADIAIRRKIARSQLKKGTRLKIVSPAVVNPDGKP